MNVDIPFTDLIGIYKVKTKKKRNIEKLKEMSLTKGTFYFENFFKEDIKPWYNSFCANRRVISVINFIRSGHTRTKNDLFRFKIVNNSICDCGELEETVEHIFGSAADMKL